MAHKVMHIITRMILGGAQENTLLTCEGLRAAEGWEVQLVTGPALGPEGELIRRARSGGIPTTVVPSMRRNLNPLLDARAFHALLGIIRSQNPHVVHTHSSKAGVLGRLAAHIARVPVIVHTIHGLPFHPYQGALPHAAYVAAERAAARWCDCLVCVARAMHSQALAAGVGRHAQYEVVYSGMEVETFLEADAHRARVRRELGFEEQDVVVGKIARLFPLKGHRYVLRAAPRVLERCPRARFLFVGDGVLREELQSRARRLGVDERIVWTGLVDASRIPEMIGAMDLLVHASLREGLPRVVVQALLGGRPVVCCDVDGAPEVVLDGVTGRLVPPKSVDELAEALVELIRDPERAARMGREGQRRFTDRFRAATMVRDLEGIYRRLLARRGLL